MLHVFNYYSLAAAHACVCSAQRGELRSPSSRFCDGAEVSLITARACLQTRPGSDGLESTLTVITRSGLVCDQSGALRYLQGSVNKDLMLRMRWILVRQCCSTANDDADDHDDWYNGKK